MLFAILHSFTEFNSFVYTWTRSLVFFQMQTIAFRWVCFPQEPSYMYLWQRNCTTANTFVFSLMNASPHARMCVSKYIVWEICSQKSWCGGFQRGRCRNAYMFWLKADWPKYMKLYESKTETSTDLMMQISIHQFYNPHQFPGNKVT